MRRGVNSADSPIIGVAADASSDEATAQINRPDRPRESVMNGRGVHIQTLAAKGTALSTLLLVLALPATAAAVPLAAATVSCAGGGSANCSLYMDVSGNASANMQGDISFDHQTGWQSANSLAYTNDKTAGENNAIAHVAASSFATFGALRSVLRADATGSGTSNLPHAASLGNSYISFQDRLTFTGGAANTSGTMTGVIRFSGLLSGSSNSSNSSLAYGYSVRKRECQRKHAQHGLGQVR